MRNKKIILALFIILLLSLGIVIAEKISSSRMTSNGNLIASRNIETSGGSVYEIYGDGVVQLRVLSLSDWFGKLTLGGVIEEAFYCRDQDFCDKKESMGCKIRHNCREGTDFAFCQGESEAQIEAFCNEDMILTRGASSLKGCESEGYASVRCVDTSTSKECSSSSSKCVKYYLGYSNGICSHTKSSDLCTISNFPTCSFRYTSANYCAIDGNVYRDFIGEDCQDNVQQIDACGSGETCSNGACQSTKTCTDVDIKCDSGHLYHFDSCGKRGDRSKTCPNGCEGTSCKSSPTLPSSKPSGPTTPGKPNIIVEKIVINDQSYESSSQQFINIGDFIPVNVVLKNIGSDMTEYQIIEIEPVKGRAAKREELVCDENNPQITHVAYMIASGKTETLNFQVPAVNGDGNYILTFSSVTGCCNSAGGCFATQPFGGFNKNPVKVTVSGTTGDVKKCKDNTLQGQCSNLQPGYLCSADGLSLREERCGCSIGTIDQPDGTCKKDIRTDTSNVVECNSNHQGKCDIENHKVCTKITVPLTFAKYKWLTYEEYDNAWFKDRVNFRENFFRSSPACDICSPDPICKELEVKKLDCRKDEYCITSIGCDGICDSKGLCQDSTGDGCPVEDKVDRLSYSKENEQCLTKSCASGLVCVEISRGFIKEVLKAGKETLEHRTICMKEQDIQNKSKKTLYLGCDSNYYDTQKEADDAECIKVILPIDKFKCPDSDKVYLSQETAKKDCPDAEDTIEVTQAGNYWKCREVLYPSIELAKKACDLVLEVDGPTILTEETIKQIGIDPNEIEKITEKDLLKHACDSGDQCEDDSKCRPINFLKKEGFISDGKVEKISTEFVGFIKGASIGTSVCIVAAGIISGIGSGLVASPTGPGAIAVGLTVGTATAMKAAPACAIIGTTAGGFLLDDILDAFVKKKYDKAGFCILTEKEQKPFSTAGVVKTIQETFNVKESTAQLILYGIIGFFIYILIRSLK